MKKSFSDFVRQKPFLFWGVSPSADLSDNALVFAILNHGDFHDVHFLLKEMGVKKVRDIFKKQMRGRNRYEEKIARFFSRYFALHASRNFES